MRLKAKHCDLPLRNVVQPKNAFKRRGLARAIEPDQTMNGTLRDFKIQTVQHLRAGITLMQVLYDERRGTHLVCGASLFLLALFACALLDIQSATLVPCFRQFLKRNIAGSSA